MNRLVLLFLIGFSQLGQAQDGLNICETSGAVAEIRTKPWKRDGIFLMAVNLSNAVTHTIEGSCYDNDHFSYLRATSSGPSVSPEEFVNLKVGDNVKVRFVNGIKNIWVGDKEIPESFYRQWLVDID